MLWLARQVLSLIPTTAMVRAFRSISWMTAGSFILVLRPHRLDELSGLADSCPAASPRRGPAHAVHVEPGAGGLVFFGSGARAQDVSIWMLDLHVHCPGLVGREIADGGAGDAQLLIHGFDVMSVDPYPGSGIALVALAEEEAAPAAGDGHEARAFKINFESKEAHIVIDGDSSVADDAGWGDVSKAMPGLHGVVGHQN